MATTGLLQSFLAAIQASLSVLLVIFYGAIAARYNMLNSSAAKTISKICVRMFLPALLITKIGSELHAGSADRYGIILLWAFICHVVSFLIGLSGHYLLRMPDWITAAIMFNNTTSYPLLLIQALDETGILSSLIVTDETTRDAIERAKSYFLVFATVSSCLTFAVGPRLIDSEHAPEPLDPKLLNDGEDNDEHSTEETSLLESAVRHSSVASTYLLPSRQRQPSRAAIHDRRPSVVSGRRWKMLNPRLRWWVLFFFDFMNAPLLGAVIGAIIGLIPTLHRAFFNDTADGGIFTAWLTASLKNIGGLFVPLPVVVAGVSLYTSVLRAKTEENASDRGAGIPWGSTAFVLVVRFILWPFMSIAVIYALAKQTEVIGSDPMLWFAMMLMPTGPPAMKLITMVEVSDAEEEDEHKIAKLLTVGLHISATGRRLTILDFIHCVAAVSVYGRWKS
jgi:auxin efflux carrier family protein